jgi:hypothetical protein
MRTQDISKPKTKTPAKDIVSKQITMFNNKAKAKDLKIDISAVKSNDN